MRVAMQPSVVVIESESNQPIKTHPHARQEASINALMEYYEKLPPELTITGATFLDAR